MSSGAAKAGDQITIRPACEHDCEFVAGLAGSLLEFGSPAWKDKHALAAGYRALLANAVSAQEPRSAVFIAESAGGEPLGFISLKVIGTVGGGERGHVADLAVTETARRLGVGSALMQIGETWARERGLAMLSLDVWSSNERALNFYRQRGYETESLSLFKVLE